MCRTRTAEWSAAKIPRGDRGRVRFPLGQIMVKAIKMRGEYISIGVVKGYSDGTSCSYWYV